MGGFGAEPWGPWSGPDIGWRGHNPYDLAGNLRGLALQVFTGEGDGSPNDIEPTSTSRARPSRTVLASLGIPRVYDDYGRGGHSPEFWNRDLRQALPRLMATFDYPVDPPGRWSYQATERTWTTRGYTLRASRDRLAWRALTDVQAGGFRVGADGPATITTAKRYARRGRYLVIVTPASGAWSGTCGARAPTGA